MRKRCICICLYKTCWYTYVSILYVYTYTCTYFVCIYIYKYVSMSSIKHACASLIITKRCFCLFVRMRVFSNWPAWVVIITKKMCSLCWFCESEQDGCVPTTGHIPAWLENKTQIILCAYLWFCTSAHAQRRPLGYLFIEGFRTHTFT